MGTTGTDGDAVDLEVDRRPAPGTDADAVLLARYGRRRATELLGRPLSTAADVRVRSPAGTEGAAGSPRRRYRPGAVLAAVAGLLVVLAWVAWASTGQNPSSVSSQLVGVGTSEPHSISVVFTATGPVASPLTCVLDATDRNSTIVGRAVVRVPSSTQTTRQVRAVVATVAPAVDVTVDGCQIPGQTGLH